MDRGFVLDNVLQTADLGEIHFSLRVPDSYDSSTAYALHIALPGWEGLNFQGVGANLRWEQHLFVSPDYVKDLIVVSPQLSDWGGTSARQTIALAYICSANK